jgi:protein-tyrosine phosphatase
MIDIHCHILPGIDDDGPARLEDVLEMARIAAGDGIRQIVATPHVKETIPSPERIRELVIMFNDALRANRIELEVFPGAEVGSMLNTSLLPEYTLNGSNYVLLEFPHSHLPQNAIEIVFNAVLVNLTPIVPHPERNPSVVRRPDLLLDLIGAGALVQVTAGSLVGNFGPEAKVCGQYLLEKGLVHFLATDAHSPGWRRPVLSSGVKAAAKIVGEAAARRMVIDNPASVLAGVPLHG